MNHIDVEYAIKKDVRNNPIVPTTALSAYLHFTPVSIR